MGRAEIGNGVLGNAVETENVHAGAIVVEELDACLHDGTGLYHRLSCWELSLAGHRVEWQTVGSRHEGGRNISSN